MKKLENLLTISLFIVFAHFSLAQPATHDGSGTNAGCQGSPSSSPPTPSFFDTPEPNSPGCTGNGWILETSTQGDATNSTANNTDNADCLYFEDDNACDVFIWAVPISLSSAFCMDFTIQLDANDQGVAMTLFSTGNLAANFPCTTPLNSCNSGSAEGAGGNLGYASFDNDPFASNSGGLNGSGALTVEFDVYDDSGTTGYGADSFSPYCDHISINEDGCMDAYLQGECAPSDMADGNPHSVSICWNPSCGTDGTLTVSMDGVEIVSLHEDISAYFVDDQIYTAFTSGYANTGDGSASYVCDFCINYGASTCPSIGGGAEAVDCVFLPVELVYFGASLNDDRSVDLDWTTNSEYENAYFSLERSYNGIDWEEVSLIPGNGTTNETIHYSAIDSDYNRSVSAVYYRLEQVDIDGSSSRSKVVSVQLDELKDELVIYPNPTKSYLNILVDDAANKNLEIYNIFGGLVLSKENLSVTELGSSHILIDTKNLVSGSYILKVGDVRRMIIVE